MTESDGSQSKRRSVGLLLIGLSFAFLGFFWESIDHQNLLRLPLGTQAESTPGYRAAMDAWIGLGLPSAVSMALGLSLFFERIWGVRIVKAASTKDFLLLCTFAGFAIPALIRSWVLRGSRIFDEESAYRFASELLLQGALSVPTPPSELAWERALFLSRDGHWFAQCFGGWPVLMTPFTAIGLDGYANAFYAGATVPAVYMVASRLYDENFARYAALLFICAPLTAFAAATWLPNTSALMASAWATYFFLRTRDDSTNLRSHVALAASLCMGLLIDPLSVTCFALPLLVMWSWERRGLTGSDIRAVLCVTVVGLVGCLVFVYLDARWSGSALLRASFDIAQAPHRLLSAALRYNVGSFGWPTALLLAALGLVRRESRLPALQFASFVTLSSLFVDAGPDTFGPVNYTELTFPLVLLTIDGSRVAYDASVRWLKPHWSHQIVPHLVFSFVLTAGLGYFTLRTANLARVAEATRMPEQAVDYVREFYRVPEQPVIVFTHGQYAHPCLLPPTKHFLTSPPAPSPDLSNEVLWVKHVSTEADLKLLREMASGRFPLIAFWQFEPSTGNCRYRLDKFFKLEKLVPDAHN